MSRDKIVRRRLADGTVKEYRYACSGKPTMGRLIAEYKASADFGRLSKNSKRAYNSYMDKIGESYHNVAVEDIRRRHVKGFRDIYQNHPATANELVKMWSVLLRYAVEAEYVAYNVARDIDRLPIGEHKRWPEAAIVFAIEHLPERIKRAVILALYTGQREGDVIRMRWSDIEDNGINVVQQKTGAKLWVPAHADLTAHLAEWKKDAATLTILANANGQPWKNGNTMAGVWMHERNRRPELTGLTFHGLRKSAAARLAEAGCTTHEIASITGHASLREIERYTREASQKQRARAAIVKLETFSKGGKQCPTSR